MSGVRVRFAPSPTGYLHVGGARTALFNWLFVRNLGGAFVLRIEDTDRERSSEEHVQAILDGMRWLGLDWDEGPHFQSRGIERHRMDALRLLSEGRAYRDFSTLEEVAADRAEAERTGTRGGVTQAVRQRMEALDEVEVAERVAKGEPHTIRFRVPDGETVWDDLVGGRIVFQNQDVEDLVILRSNGTPTYNFAVVSDDADMGITHVIRGDDHLSNTPKQILLYEALGQPIPSFGHVPLILGPDGKRLSKRHGATAVGSYESEGILPSTMVNFLALLGWSPGDDREAMALTELVAAFSIDRVVRKSAIFDPEKLHWLNGTYISRLTATELEPLVTPLLVSAGLTDERALSERREWYLSLIDLLKTRAKRISDIVSQAVPYFVDALEPDLDAVEKHWMKDPEAVLHRLSRLREVFVDSVEWDEESLETELRTLSATLEIGAGRLIHPLRVALTGQAVSPGIFEVLAHLGREKSVFRVTEALDRIARTGKS